MTLAKYALQKVLQLGNEDGFMHGTYLNEANIERFKMLLVSEFRSQGDSFHQMEHLQLKGYFSALLQTYVIKNTEILHEMCKYLNAHISSASSGFPSQNHSSSSFHQHQQQ